MAEEVAMTEEVVEEAAPMGVEALVKEKVTTSAEMEEVLPVAAEIATVRLTAMSCKEMALW